MSKIFFSIITITLLFGCGDDVTNKTKDNIILDSVDTAPHPIPNPSQNQINDKEFPPRPPSI